MLAASHGSASHPSPWIPFSVIIEVKVRLAGDG